MDDIQVGSIWDLKNTAGSWVEVTAVRSTSVDYISNTGRKSAAQRDIFLRNFTPVKCPRTAGDEVHAPQHYQVFPDKEAIEIIACSMTTEQFYGYCLGNFLKYRLRIGAKDEVQQELEKSNKYKELYDKHKHLCK